jgi:hypothetical protein
MTTPSGGILVEWEVIVDLATSGLSRRIDNAGRISFRSHRAGKKSERATLATFEPTAGGSYRVSLPGDAPLDVVAGFVRAVESPAGDRRKELNLWITSWETLAANAVIVRIPRVFATLFHVFSPSCEDVASSRVRPSASATLSSIRSIVEEKSRCPVPVLPYAISEKSCGSTRPST